ncbi:tRNA (guanosine(37)-N1)-methyltransferase TrmD [Nonomuraea longispora]|uniref:tRNA (guanine-N(1)-)-methyltransferase n=1 Tax=Nonomuraea longispora TaxID=1848320 RepID=A0A4R4N9J4_9ACTN|nr:tRNA (guanosine(37)-N1)-methyltransferase TrmD [Nonomuraea longispora]TDC03920.1 tRNA (guanosine(37)-N1)-methyltransferase TrmD [Nonomuraea longispora]
MTRIDIISIFPEYFAPLDVSLIGKARERGTIDVRVHQLRDWAHDVHKTVDDTPYGGGPGMVMKPEVWGEAIDSVIGDGAPRMVVPTPSGRPFTQELAQELAGEPWLLFACGRYEGIDTRVVEEYAGRLRVDEVCIGDYVLAGGEVAVLVMVEAVGRLLPGVLGNAQSAVDDSFAPGSMRNLVEGPVYTKPPVWRGREVPDVLLSGHHGKIARWRRDEALRRTVRNRPELAAELDPETLDKHDRKLLEELSFRVEPEDMAN